VRGLPDDGPGPLHATAQYATGRDFVPARHHISQKKG
jgi:hypothetical protein